MSRLQEGDPADKAGVLVGDVVEQIDDVSTRGMTVGQAIARMRGPAGTRVRLSIGRRGQSARVEMSIERALIRSRAVALDVGDDAGHLKITSIGSWPVLGFDTGKPVAMKTLSDDTFYADDEDHKRISFTRDSAGAVTGAILDPGPLEQKGVLFRRPRPAPP